MNKNYQVFYVLKKNKKEYQEHMFISAENQKEAVRKCKEAVFEQTGRNAFRPKAIRTDYERYVDAEINLLEK